MNSKNQGWNWILAIESGIKAFTNPNRQGSFQTVPSSLTRLDAVAALGEATGLNALCQMRDRMLLNRTGRRILRDRPFISSQSLPLESLKSRPAGTLGHSYAQFLQIHQVSPDTRSPIKYISDPELAYVMLRYRQVHDFWHILFGLDSVSVESELALKAIEWSQTGLPMTLLSTLLGPVRLNSEERERLMNEWMPWAIQAGSRSAFLLNVMYEEELDKPLDQLRKELGIFLHPRRDTLMASQM